MSPTGAVQEEIDWETGTIIINKPIGDFVVCNLNSLVLNNIVHKREFDEETLNDLREATRVAVRFADNVISVNTLPTKQAEYTNAKYRSIGVGQQGIAALLAKLGIPFGSQEAVEYIAELEELIMLFAIEASADLGAEKGSYKVFEGSEWNTGAWIDSKPISDKYAEEWEVVRAKAQSHMRNAYLRANAPTGSTSILAGSTAATEGIFDIIYQDGKKDALLPIVVPHLDQISYFFYTPVSTLSYEGTRELGQMWAILHNEQRQIWTDQGTSFNMYVPTDIKAPNLLRLHMEVWERGIKTTYYVRSRKSEDECLGCSA